MYFVFTLIISIQTPLHCAARYGRIEFVQLLLDRGAEVNVKDNTVWNILLSFSFSFESFDDDVIYFVC